jgi:hypothetical protein
MGALNLKPITLENCGFGKKFLSHNQETPKMAKLGIINTRGYLVKK